MQALVTGAAGFIGSHLTECLLARGDTVRAIDCLTSYYSASLKRENLEAIARYPNCEIIVGDLRSMEVEDLFSGIDVVFHQAGQPGVRASWDEGFVDYVQHNILATQRLLEAARRARVSKFIFASSSSIYGNAQRYPTRETDLPSPFSPYGVTKLAAEHLCSLYAANYGLQTISLRYFTIYGPRQRPDMAMHRLIQSALSGQPFPIYGDGSQIRDFTYVDDAVEANLRAADAEAPAGSVINIAGGSNASLSEVLQIVGNLVGGTVPLDRQARQAGDVDRTSASTERARTLLGWRPSVELHDGLARQVAWQSERLSRIPVEEHT